MARIYCPKESIRGESINICDRQKLHYLGDVLRLRPGDDIIVFDGQEHEYHCQIQELSKRESSLLIKKKVKIEPHAGFNLAVACALPRQKNRFDDLIDKLSQLGVDKIIPMITERVVVRWDYNQKQRHLNRWRKIAEQACAQSGRKILPAIEPIKEINQILSYAATYELKLIPTLLEIKRNLKGIACGPLPKSILVLIGPEGDFTKQELAKAESSGFIPITLGDLVLRVETAAIAVAAFFMVWESIKHFPNH